MQEGAGVLLPSPYCINILRRFTMLILSIMIATLILLSFVVIKSFKLNFNILLCFGLLLLTVLSVLLYCNIDDLYYNYGSPTCSQYKVIEHPNTKIFFTIYDYIAHETEYVLDENYELIEIDWNEVKVEFSKDESGVYRRIYEPRGLWRFIVRENKREEILVVIEDYKYHSHTSE